MTVYIGAGLLILGLVIGVLAARLFETMTALEKRVKDLEDCKQKRLPYNTAAGAEDAIAVMLDVLRHSTEIDLERGALQQRAEKAIEILRMVRGGPDGYDPDKPAGKRP
jgi:hypothetical protein